MPMDGLASVVTAVGWHVFDADVFFPSLVWAAFYAICGEFSKGLSKEKEYMNEGKIPLHSYVGPMMHQLGTHPVLLVLVWRHAYISGSGLTSKEWWEGSWDTVGSPYALHVLYSSLGLMFEGFFHSVTLWKSSKLEFFGFAVHHLVTILGCSMFLLAPSGASIGIFISLNAEISSGFYCLFKVRPSPHSAALYALTQPLSLVLGIWGTVEFSGRVEDAPWASFCQLLCVLLVVIRSAGYLLEASAIKKQLFLLRRHTVITNGHDIKANIFEEDVEMSVWENSQQ